MLFVRRVRDVFCHHDHIAAVDLAVVRGIVRINSRAFCIRSPVYDIKAYLQMVFKITIFLCKKPTCICR